MLSNGNYIGASYLYIELISNKFIAKEDLKPHMNYKLIECAFYCYLISATSKNHVYGPETLALFLDVLQKEDLKEYESYYQDWRSEQHQNINQNQLEEDVDNLEYFENKMGDFNMNSKKQSYNPDDEVVPLYEIKGRQFP